MSGLNNNEFRLPQFSVEVCDIIRQIPAGQGTDLWSDCPSGGIFKLFPLGG